MSKSSWIVLWVAFSAGVIATFIQFSIPPVLPLLQSQYNVTYTDSALLMSLFALMTLLSAVPGGFIIQKYGVRFVGLLGLGILFVGVICSYFADSFTLLLVSRMVQGIGFGLVSVAAPSAIGQFVSPQMMNVSMGIWSTWIPLGSLIMFLFAPYIVSAYQFDTYWGILIIILIISFILYAKFIPRPVYSGDDASEAVTNKLPKNSFKDEMKNKNIWIAAGAFASFTFTLFSFNTWISTYLVESSSMSLITAAIVPSIISLFMIGSNLYAGLLLKKFENKLVVFLIPPIIMALLWPTFLIDNYLVLYGSAAVLGIIGGFVPTIIFASVPLLAKRKETIGIAMSIVIIGENAGILIGPEVFGAVRDYTGNFSTSFWLLLFVGFITVISAVYIWRSWKFASEPKQASNSDYIQDENFQ